MCRTKFELTATIFDKRGRILSIGKNSYTKSHPVQKHHAERVGLPDKIFLHAEIAAIVKCRQLHKAHKILVTRFDRDGNPASAKPCRVCREAIKSVGIEVIEHT